MVVWARVPAFLPFYKGRQLLMPTVPIVKLLDKHMSVCYLRRRIFLKIHLKSETIVSFSA